MMGLARSLVAGLIVTLALLILTGVAFVLGRKSAPGRSVLAAVPDTVYAERRNVEAAAPTPTITGLQRVTHHEAPPELVMIGTVPVRAESTAIASPPDSLGIRRSYAAPSTEGAKSDQPTLPYVAGRFGHGVLELWAERSDSSLLYQRHRVHPPFDFVRDEASTGIVVHEERGWVRFVRGAGVCAAAAGGGALVGAIAVGKDRLAGAAAGAAAACTATIVF